MSLAADTNAIAPPPETARATLLLAPSDRRDAPAAWIDAAIALFPGAGRSAAVEPTPARDDIRRPKTHS